MAWGRGIAYVCETAQTGGLGGIILVLTGWDTIMALTQEEKEDVYLNVSIELVKMFDVLTNVYTKPGEAEQAQLVAEIEIDIRKGWEHFKLPE